MSNRNSDTRGLSQYKEPLIFAIGFVLFFSLFARQMGLVNMLNTMMNTAYDLLMNTVFYLMAICVLAGALSGLRCMEQHRGA